MLELTNITKKYGRREALRGVSAKLEQGVYGLLGANGSGKTTLLRCICGLFSVNSGTILYNGKPASISREFKRDLGYLPQSFGIFYELTLFEMMDYFCAIKKISSSARHSEISRVLGQVNLSERMHSRISSLSGGMVRRAGIAQALLGNPRIVLMDEPTAGLDPEERARFKNVVAERDHTQTILISTHIVEDIEAVCDRVLVIHEGRFLFAGLCRDLKNLALDKVYMAQDNEVVNIIGKKFVLRKTETDNNILCRVLASETQVIDRAEPTLEDGYMCVIKDI